MSKKQTQTINQLRINKLRHVVEDAKQAEKALKELSDSTYAEIEKLDMTRPEDVNRGMYLLAVYDEFTTMLEDGMSDYITLLKTLLKAPEGIARECKDSTNAMRILIREKIETAVNTTGVVGPYHDNITVARVNRLTYDKAEALEFAKENAPDCTETRLKVRDFDKWLKSHDWAGAESVPEIQVRIDTRLGHILIEHEFDEGQSNE